MARVVFYYGLGSRYSYLAATQIAGLAAHTGATFEWRPLFSGDLMRRLGRSPFEGAPVSGQYDWTYRELDARRWAALYGVPFIEPSPFALPPLAYALAAEASRGFGAIQSFSLALFHGIFATGAPVAMDGVAQAASMARIEPDALADAMAKPETGTAIEATVDDALAAGVFGVPTFVLDDALYWGNDRIPLVRHRLMQGPQK